MVEKKCFAMFCQNYQFFGCTPRLKIKMENDIQSNGVLFKKVKSISLQVTFSSQIVKLSRRLVV